MDNLKGKKVFFIGDSIMAADGVVLNKELYPYMRYNLDKQGVTGRAYPTLLKEKLGIEILKNIAVGGSTVEHQKVRVMENDVALADIFVIALGVNDFSSSVPMGKIPEKYKDEHDETFIGRYCSILDYLYKNNPSAKIVLMTPLQKDTLTHNVSYISKKDSYSVNDEGLRLIDYRNAILEIGAFYSCVVCDMYAESGLNKYNIPLYTYEGTHPTNEGYEFVIKPLIEAMRKLY